MRREIENKIINYLSKYHLWGEYRRYSLRKFHPRLGKIKITLPVFGKKEPVFTIVPSFKCNLSCTYCQYKGLEKDHPDMNPLDFSKIIRWLHSQGIRYIRLMGGEITIHPKVLDYLKVLKKYGFTVRYFANLMYSTRILEKVLDEMNPEMVERFIIHYKDLSWYNKKQHELFLKNVALISNRGYTIHLRHNLVNRSTDYDYAIELAKKYKMKYFTTTPLFPGAKDDSGYTSVEEWRKLVPNIIDIYKKCKEASIIYDFTKPLPPCFFTKEDFKRYYYKIGKNPCLTGPNLFRPIVYPDQKVVFCPGMHLRAPKPLLKYKTYFELYNYFWPRFEKIRWEPLFEKCKTCKLSKNKSCQGLCIGFKFYNRCKGYNEKCQEDEICSP